MMSFIKRKLHEARERKTQIDVARKVLKQRMKVAEQRAFISEKVRMGREKGRKLARTKVPSVGESFIGGFQRVQMGFDPYASPPQSRRKAQAPQHRKKRRRSSSQSFF